MAWDGYRLPNFNNVVKWYSWGTTVPDYVGFNAAAAVDLTCQLYWGIKRGFRLPVTFVPPEPGNFPMMIKAPAETPILMPSSDGLIFGDWFIWSFNDLVYLGTVAQVGVVSWGNPNEYMGAILVTNQMDWEYLGWTLPAGWPLP